nr:extracellular nuclease 1 [Bursaphelenchus xylophilus]
MKQIWIELVFVCLLVDSVASKSPKTASNLWQGKPVTIMTFNTWQSGANVDDGINKIAKHILQNDPDIVGVQEIGSREKIQEMADALSRSSGRVWWYVHVENSDRGLLTKHQINGDSIVRTGSAVGAQILFDDGRKATLYSLHLDYKSYGPYLTLFRTFNNFTFLDEVERNITGRSVGITELLASEGFQAALANTETEPLFVVGDFNTPSHLDYTKEALSSRGFTFEWPATQILQNSTGLVDSFREVHPDPVKHPGNTWSTVWKTIADYEGFQYVIPEPQDRIDLILYKSSLLKTVSSESYAGDFVPKPQDVRHNDWPSDHYALVSTFKGV